LSIVVDRLSIASIDNQTPSSATDLTLSGAVVDRVDRWGDGKGEIQRFGITIIPNMKKRGGSGTTADNSLIHTLTLPATTGF
jgi:hypothetical protein